MNVPKQLDALVEHARGGGALLGDEAVIVAAEVIVLRERVAELERQVRHQMTARIVADDRDSYEGCEACTCCTREACLSRPPGCGWSDRFGYTCPCTGE